MAADNYSRLMQLAEQVFAFKNDPSQLHGNKAAEAISRVTALPLYTCNCD